LANRNTVRAEVLTDLLAGAPADTTTAEHALGYRLRQTHVGVVLWSAGESGSGDLSDLERHLGRLARELGTTGQPLFIAQDRAAAWGWIPLGPTPAGPVPSTDLRAAGIHVATGIPATGADGFRSSHRDALLAQSVALAALDRARPLTSYGDPEVRAA